MFLITSRSGGIEMILSQIELDGNRYKTIKALKNPVEFHRSIQKALAQERKKCLWRVDELRGKKYLLIVSEQPFEYPEILENEFGKKESPLKYKDYDPFLFSINDGSIWRFKLKGNPVRREKANGMKNGAYRQLFTVEDQIKWLERRAENNGFKLIEVIPKKKEEYHFKKHREDKKYLTFQSITFEGTLEVTDFKKFKNLLCYGIGHGKAYGMGLFSVVRR